MKFLLVKTSLKDKASIVKQLKTKTGFTLKKKDYDATMLRLKSANAFLETLVTAGTGQHTSNKRRSDYRVISLLRKLAKSLFNALENAATDCHCPVSHDACLELVARDLVFIHNIDTEDEVAKNIDFHVTLSSEGSDYSQTRLQPQSRWAGFRLQPGNPEPPPSASLSTSTTAFPRPRIEPQTPKDQNDLGALSPTRKWATGLFTSKTPGQPNKRRKMVSFAPVSLNATDALVENSVASLAGLSFSDKLQPQITNIEQALKICQLLKHSKGKTCDLYRDDLPHGYIVDSTAPRNFRLYSPRWKSVGEFRPQTANSEFTAFFTLRQILGRDLQAPTSGLFRLDPLMKLRITHAIAASVLYIYDTPWLSQVLTLDSVVFFLDENSHIQLDKIQPFVLRPITFRTEESPHPESDLITASTHKALPIAYPPVLCSRPLDATAFSLALILIQLMLERVDEHIDLARICASTPNGQPMLAFSAIQNLHVYTSSFLYRLTEGGGINFENAVRWCLESYRGTRGFFDEAFCHAFRTEVVDVLEQEVGVLEKLEKVQSY